MRSPTCVERDGRALRSSASNDGDDDRVDRQGAAARRVCAASAMICSAGSRSASRSERPTSTPLAARNVLAMPPPITNAATRSQQAAEDADLVLDLRAADRADERLPRMRSSARRARRSSRFHQESCEGRQVVRDALGRGVRAMRRPERVVDVDVAERRELRARRRDRSLPPRDESARFRAATMSPSRSASTAAPARPARRSRRRTRPASRVSSASRRRPGASERLGTTLPSGRPRCESDDRPRARDRAASAASRAPRRSACRRRRAPSLIGTLRSSRTRTALAAQTSTSRRSCGIRILGSAGRRLESTQLR